MPQRQLMHLWQHGLSSEDFCSANGLTLLCDTLLLGEVVFLEGPPVAMLKTLRLREKVPDLS
jgi:hypothetical protein